MVQKLNTFESGKTVIGLTGGFGTGKSTVAHLFEELGASIVDADRLAHEALMKGSPVYDQIAELFKAKDFSNALGFDRKKIARAVFAKPALRKKLEAIIHPYVFNRMVQETAQAESPVVVLEIPLLFETGFDLYCHKTLVVSAPEEKIIKRLAEKDFSASEVRARLKAQMPLTEKIKKADLLVDNSQNIQQTKREVEKIWKKFRPVSKGAV